MLAHCKQMMEYNDGYAAINPTHQNLIAALCTAVALAPSHLRVIDDDNHRCHNQAEKYSSGLVHLFVSTILSA